MRRVIWSVMTSIDGRSAAAGEGFETIDWFRADEEWLDYSVELLDDADTLLFGGVTFAGMEQYWPTADGPVAERMNALEKVGFSRTARDTAWQNARIETDPVAVVSALREGDGRSAIVMGSANLAGTLSAHGLVDEYRFAMTPVLLGGGVPVALPGSSRRELDLADVRRFGSGIVEMRCTPQ
ncbi:MAG TPA: dihydrofolate reductase family protein [Lapillicoccus sp.]|nr:dihydrofolate reductase family protein [Lapillicoccus sp.]